MGGGEGENVGGLFVGFEDDKMEERCIRVKKKIGGERERVKKV